MQDGEELRHQATLGEADERRALQAGRVHHRQDVFAALFERRRGVEAIGKPDPPLVERGDAYVVTLVLECAAVQLLFPDQLAVRDEWGTTNTSGPDPHC